MTEGKREHPAHEEYEGDAGLGAAPQGTSDDGRPDVEQEPGTEGANDEAGAAEQAERSDTGHA